MALMGASRWSALGQHGTRRKESATAPCCLLKDRMCMRKGELRQLLQLYRMASQHTVLGLDQRRPERYSSAVVTAASTS